MSLHDDVQQILRKDLFTLNEQGVDVMPNTLALRALDAFGGVGVEPHLAWGCVEHFKQMARALLRIYEPRDETSEAYQGDMFSGHLQARYPLPHADGDEPVYRVRSLLSTAELDWNIAQLRKSAQARLRHADALQSYRDTRSADAA